MEAKENRCTFPSLVSLALGAAGNVGQHARSLSFNRARRHRVRSSQAANFHAKPKQNNWPAGWQIEISSSGRPELLGRRANTRQSRLVFIREPMQIRSNGARLEGCEWLLPCKWRSGACVQHSICSNDKSRPR